MGWRRVTTVKKRYPTMYGVWRTICRSDFTETDCGIRPFYPLDVEGCVVLCAPFAHLVEKELDASAL
jgi:hypothetical protein